MSSPSTFPDGGVAGPLIGQEALTGLLASAEPPALLDVRWYLGGPPGIDSYLAGHLPGACFVDLDKDLSGPPGRGGRHPLPEAHVFEQAMRNAGLRAGQFAVAYDDGDATIAARLWWMLRYYGHRGVAVLDGGYRAWAGAGLPVSTDVPQPVPGDFEVSAVGDMPLLDDDAAAALARSGFLLDARAGDRYRGEVEPVDPAAGHIPGAISAPTRGNVGPDGRFLGPDRLAKRFADLGLPASAGQATGPDGGPLVGAYCGSGVTAAHEVLALELAGLPAALYVGSWSAWSADPTRPVATGPESG
ncbi:MAG TPA: sulfurtransferase [Streptosporangiaceae bacterium]